MKFSAALKGYWRDKQLQFSANTIGIHERVFEHFLAFTGDCAFSEISSDNVRRLADASVAQNTGDASQALLAFKPA